jgi:hypothetical protein
MSRRTGKSKPQRITLSEPPSRDGKLRHVGGSSYDDWNDALLNQAVNAIWFGGADIQTRQKLCAAAMTGLTGIAPRDELEGMLAVQMIAAHNAAMESHRRAMWPDQSFEGRRQNVELANKLSRTWTMLLEALNKHRGKGQQKVTVEHVHVHSGGQAIVGHVEHPGGGDREEVEEQPHAQQIANAPEPALRGKHAERDAVPIACDEERPLPDARGKVSRRADRE